jgi:hypothetical protein
VGRLGVSLMASCPHRSRHRASTLSSAPISQVSVWSKNPDGGDSKTVQIILNPLAKDLHLTLT